MSAVSTDCDSPATRAALDRCHFEGAAVAHVFFAFTKVFTGIRTLLLGGLFLKPGDEYAEVKGMHLKGNLVLGPLQVVP